MPSKTKITAEKQQTVENETCRKSWGTCKQNDCLACDIYEEHFRITIGRCVDAQVMRWAKGFN